MEGYCDVCGTAFVDGDRVVHLSFSSWDGADGRMSDGWSREDHIVHDDKCLAKMV